MPDDITPEPTDDVPTGGTPQDPGGPESWDTATQANPAATPAGDLTQSIPADTTRSMAGVTPPTGTPVTAAAGAGAGAGAGAAGGAGGGRTRTSAQRAWMIAVIAAAVLVLGAGIALAATSGGGKKKASPCGCPEHPGPDDHGRGRTRVPAHRARSRRRRRAAATGPGRQGGQLPRRPAAVGPRPGRHRLRRAGGRWDHALRGGIPVPEPGR